MYYRLQQHGSCKERASNDEHAREEAYDIRALMVSGATIFVHGVRTWPGLPRYFLVP